MIELKTVYDISCYIFFRRRSDNMNKYYLGLDMGSASVGWAVTDENYHLVRRKGKDLWGVRTFDVAQTAKERRVTRGNRRRQDRRKQRIQILQELLGEEVLKTDPGFFHRMKESRYVVEDKRTLDGKQVELPYALFVDKDYTDKEYYKQFPTINHLIVYLMTTSDTPDIRLVYLALHYYMKNRGNFLHSGDINNVKDINDILEQLDNVLETFLDGWNLKLKSHVEDIKSIYNRDLGRGERKKAFVNALGAKTKAEKAFCSLISGGSTNLAELFDDSSLKEIETPKIEFASSSLEDKIDGIQESLEDRFAVIEAAKRLYDWKTLTDILGDSSSLAEARVNSYQMHHEQLVELKYLVKEYLDRKVFQDVFVSPSIANNYPAYIGHTKINGKKKELEVKRTKRNDFYSYVKKQVIEPIKKKVSDEAVLTKLSEIESLIEVDKYLPLQVNSDNGVIPYQVKLNELTRIFDNLENRIPVLKEIRDKIIKTFKFRIPYYVGSLNGVVKNGKRTNWMVRKEEGKIYPWNFEDKVDLEASAEQFIRRMTNKCTYLVNEDVLPKYSLLYSKYLVLSELNNLRLDGRPLDVKIKQDIYENIFKKNRKVTLKKIKKYLLKEGIITDDDELSGLADDVKSSLTAYHDFKEKLGHLDLSEAQMENIILNITLFGDDKKLLKKRLAALYPFIDDKSLNRIATLNYRDWGRLSERFLSGITSVDQETGELRTIIQCMYETQANLMQLLAEPYHFVEAIEKENPKVDLESISYRIVNDLYVSPAVKRQIWQTLLVIKDIKQVMKHDPERIFIEMAREKQESKKTKSRKQVLSEVYKKAKGYEHLFEKLNSLTEEQLRSKKIYLYFTQLGKCMYSGEPIDFENLVSANSNYDIDHIYPQSKTMDDSFNNIVLVKKSLNAYKSNHYPIDKNIRNNEKVKALWNTLVSKGLITKEKYERLIRSTPFSDEELAGFIARQLVETRQSTKAVAEILSNWFPESEIVYSKAKNVSNFRQDFEILKVRELNDCHHAHDAYLNIVVGNAYHTKFTNSPYRFIKNKANQEYNLRKLLQKVNKIESNGVVAWVGQSENNPGTIATVKKVIRRNTVLISRMVKEVDGQLFDLTLMKKGKGQVPIKSSDERLTDISKYGGYNKATGAYFAFVKYLRGKKIIKSFEYVPVYLAKKIDNDSKLLQEYLTTEKGLKDVKILVPKILINSLFKYNGSLIRIPGRYDKKSLVVNIDSPLLLDSTYISQLKVIESYMYKKRNAKSKDTEILLTKYALEQLQDLDSLFDVIAYKLNESIYCVVDDKYGKLMKCRDNFISLDKETKCEMIYELLRLFQCNSQLANLTKIGATSKFGSIIISKNLKDTDKMSIIHQSPSGIFEHEIELTSL